MRILVGIAAFLTATIGLAVLYVVIRGRLPILGSDWQRLTPSDILSALALGINTVLALGALWVALVTYQEGIRSGEQQAGLLDKSRAALEGVLGSLGKQQETLDKSRQALEEVLTATRGQFQLVEEQNKRELERLNRRPALDLRMEGKATQGGKVLVGTPQPEGWMRLTVVIRNTGNASVSKPTFVIAAEPATVKLRAPGFGTVGPNRLQLVAPMDLHPFDIVKIEYTYDIDVLMEPKARAKIVCQITGENLPLKVLTIDVERTSD
jgi:hypothetical protein